MKTITTCILSPEIHQSFNKYLLMDALERSHWRFESEILPKALKKLRPQDVGRIKEFEKLANLYRELYERKVTQKANYQAEVESFIKKRPYIHATSRTCKFTRFESL